MSEIRVVVIDTQALLDWLVFADPACRHWTQLLEAGQWKWIFTSEMKAEFDAVARKGFGDRWPVPVDATAEAWARLAHPVPDPPPQATSGRLVCTDRDDQKFIDLAIAHHADALVTRDKALLRLARKSLQRHGVRICLPLAWPD